MIGLQLGVSCRVGGTSGCGREEEVKYLQKGGVVVGWRS